MDQSAFTDAALKRAAALGPMIAEAVPQIEAQRRIPPALVEALHAARLFRLLLPRFAGGEEEDPATYLLTIAEVARHDASVAWNLFVANSTVLIAAYVAPEVALEIFANPRSVLAWGPPNEVTAIAVPGGYRLSGRFDFASGCRLANWMGAHCRVREGDGSFRLNHLGRPAVRTLLFPMEQATLLDTWNPIGLRGTASDSYTVEDIFIPEAFSATREDPDECREPGPLYAFTQTGLYAIGVAGVALGTAESMLREFIALAIRKTPRGQALLADDHFVQHEIARAEARLSAARAFLLDVLQGLYGKAKHTTEDRARVRLASVHAIHEALAVCDFAHKAAGVDAIFPGSQFEQRFRDMHTLSQQIQSRSGHYTAVGQVMLDRAPLNFL